MGLKADSGAASEVEGDVDGEESRTGLEGESGAVSNVKGDTGGVGDYGHGCAKTRRRGLQTIRAPEKNAPEAQQREIWNGRRPLSETGINREQLSSHGFCQAELCRRPAPALYLAHERGRCAVGE